MTDETIVCHVARLAKIGLTEDEKGLFQKDLERMLAFLSALNQLVTDGVEPLRTPAGHVCPLRADEVAQDASVDQILFNAPSQGQNMFLVPTMVESA
jgi:aspartyl-tRNA(Asn)/glutamyl-tRNA(Gln) amidotransferase subunit C